MKDSSQLFLMGFPARSRVLFTLNFNNVQVDVAAHSTVFIDITNILNKIQKHTCFCILTVCWRLLVLHVYLLIPCIDHHKT